MKILLAVSGGIDSMYLANRALADAGGLFGFAGPMEFAVAHCNFSLRAEESDGDEAFVRDWCTANGVRCIIRRFDTKSYAEKKGISIEMSARDLRYSWFAQLCSEEGFDAVAVGHNANDNAETLILNLLRGTGMKGICGMKKRGLLPVENSGAALLRPLLDTGRDEIREWMESRGLPWREDSSNSEYEYRRNIIRNEVFPIFKRINPSFTETFRREMTYFSKAFEFIEECCDNCGLDRNTINTDSLMTQRNWEYLLFRLTEGHINQSNYENLVSRLKSGRQISGKRFGDYIASSSALILDKSREKLPDAKSQVSYGIVDRSEIIRLKQPEGLLIMDADKLAFPLRFRRWKKGDWMVPFGMKGRKKLSDIFSDLHFSIPQKTSAIVLEHPSDPDRIAAIAGVRIDDSVKVTPETSRVLRLGLKEQSSGD